MSALAEGLARYLHPAQLELLRSTHVGIAGAGGLGSNVAFMLVRSGIRHVTIVDFDVVEAANLNRQAYVPSDVGEPKVSALARHLRNLEPAAEIAAVQAKLTPDNTALHFASCAVVVEALDGASEKAMCYAALRHSGCYYVGASGLGGWGGPPMRIQKIGAFGVCVGDFTCAADADNPPLAPRVMQAAALQADAVLAYILR